MQADELRAKLADAGARHTTAMAAKEEASAELTELVPRARRAGFPPSEIVRLTGLSRQRVYELTHPRFRSGRP
jgi:hypothetical protein